MHMNTVFNTGKRADIMSFDDINPQGNSNFNKTEDDGSHSALNSEDATLLTAPVAVAGNDPNHSEVCIMYICVTTYKDIAI